ncbi:MULTISPECIES: AbgT family transporter [Pseudidiomarina]|uniref:Aminobenzoyl-glutamate transport protein n=4 Tax=Pseudidiomarina TaxID=2800384 RepID=A0A368UNV3_9GAMM|nr:MULTISPECIES: AbgT family transporter [Pseudidiomarina]MDT7525073.1 AbgT family transporter [Pseudidiomarina sp. GXY010]PWW07906.1 aminobenzoyl-glutamate transport protein [Pseudidiomarina maritima]RBP86912.1 aminobenzoyl-glutamate transport protein [Pseudidiomarina tainanensis]RCW29074.1 aminobenzoyl-glutamate transport protein [Pseudidiomarina tainanensis]
MSSQPTTSSDKGFIAFVERAGKRIPDPVIIFIYFLVGALVLTWAIGGLTFTTYGGDGQPIAYEIKNMLASDNVVWLFDNALLANWLGFGGGVLGVILIVMLGVGIAEHSGLFGAILKKVSRGLPINWLPLFLVFIGIMSSIATDAGYLILIPLAGLLYAGLNKNPLIGMAAAFAGVSAGFSANLIPATPIDVIIGVNAQVFAEAQGIPFTNQAGEPLTPATMNYYFILASTFVLGAVGAWVTLKFVQPRLEQKPYTIPAELELGDFDVTAQEQKGLRAAGIALVVALLAVYGLAVGPLAPYQNAEGATITPYLNNVILLITFVFTAVGVAFGVASGRFTSMQDVVKAMVKQMDTMGYILVLTFFCYNFLGVLSYSGLGAYITYLGATLLTNLGLQSFPVLLLIGFILVTAIINIFVGGLTSKWMLLGPIFIPMLYLVNSEMTPDLVAAAFRVADSSTNIITPMMSYAGIILAFMRKYNPQLTFGEMIAMMVPYSLAFMLVWTALLVAFFSFGIPLGF